MDLSPVSAVTTSQARRHELRVIVEGGNSASDVVDLVAPHLDAAVSNWTVVPLFAGTDAPPYVVVGQGDAEVGTPAYARRVNTLAQRLFDTGAFSRVEADLPVRAYAPPEEVGAFGRSEDLPGTEVMRWARNAIACEQAWQLALPAGGRSRGEGILVGHPDSGYSNHRGLGLSALDLDHDWDAISNDDDALDPLVPPRLSPWPLPNPGHGTSTASVIVGRGDEAAGVVGVAPLAKLVPIRATESVVQLFDSDVARSVDYARRVGCHVVSMSLGGKGFFGLRDAIQRAVDSGMLVMAAAGNKVGIVVAPASYDNCIAVAATGIGDVRWDGSSRGRAVDVAAPGWSVHVAAFGWDHDPPERLVNRSSGTSFAVAHLAGVAALWLAYHGVDTLRARYRPNQIQAVFLHLLRTAGTRRPPGWDDNWGIGVVDARALLGASLPDPGDIAQGIGAFGSADDPADRLSALLGTIDPDELRTALSKTLGLAAADLDARLRRFEGELAYLLLEEDEFRESLLASGRPGAFPAGPVSVPPSASPDLRAALRT